MKYYIGVDLGGTNIVAGIVTTDGQIINKKSIKTCTDRDSTEIIKNIEEVIIDVIKDSNVNISNVLGIGIGSAGQVHNGVVLYARNLGFENIELEKIISERLGIKTAVCNDANAVALAEATYGAGKGYSSLVAITIGTGIGGGIIINGNIVDGINGGAADIGHIIVEQGGRICGCGNRGCFEAHCSATALIKATKEAMLSNLESKLWDFSGDMNRVDGRTVFSALEVNDSVAKKIFDKYTYDFATALQSIIAFLQPDVICIGGGMSAEGDKLLIPILNQLKRNYPFSDSPLSLTKVKMAELKNDAGIIGAAIYCEKVLYNKGV